MVKEGTWKRVGCKGDAWGWLDDWEEDEVRRELEEERGEGRGVLSSP